MIVSENIEITAKLPVDNLFIEQELKARGIDPLRWAVIAVDNNILIICVSYEK